MAKTSPKTPDSPVEYELNTDSVSAPKGHATPTRREREAANKRPLVPSDRRQASKDSRAKEAELRERARLGMARGEEKYLPVRDRGPQKRYIRDYIDARFSIGEVLVPVLFLVIFMTLFPAGSAVPQIGMIVLWAFFIVAVVDALLLSQRIKKKLEAKFGDDKVESRIRWYIAMRSLQLRVLRMPKPQVKRGQYPS